MTSAERDPDDLREEAEDQASVEPDTEANPEDAAEQSRAVDDEPRSVPSVGPEMDEYDAVEQSVVVDYEDDYRP